ncbi:sigma-54-dependent Fis family transcriptional regulator [Pseudomonas duriflava]|nr:sigma 54-interacting transcriptional regulator [Pseudomonas duriflava]
MRQFESACKAFKANVPVLLQGETGTGKEIFARSLHDTCCPNAPFVAINCSAIPESLIEAELFGYMDGAFTGGRRGGSMGQIEAANGGTLLLDEIGDMPLLLQTRLLRVLQERSVTRLGSRTPIALNIRIISATHCNLKQRSLEKVFREDLYYRLSGFQITLPRLNQRQDLETLIQRLLQPHGTYNLSPEARRLLLDYAWPGNIRQLEQVLRLAAALAGDEPTLAPDHLPELHKRNPSDGPLQTVLMEAISTTLHAKGGNISATAQALGISRTTLYKKLKQQGKSWAT